MIRLFSKRLTCYDMESSCVNAVDGSGPGYRGFGYCSLTDKHPNVRYGHEHCPNNCADFAPDTRRTAEMSRSTPKPNIPNNDKKKDKVVYYSKSDVSYKELFHDDKNKEDS